MNSGMNAGMNFGGEYEYEIDLPGQGKSKDEGSNQGSAIGHYSDMQQVKRSVAR